MNEEKLWQKFCENGTVADYLNYRNCVNSVADNMQQKTELKPLDKNNGTGARNKRTEYR